jgi:hypothetical protein
MALAQAALHVAHADHDRAAYRRAMDQEEAAKTLPDLYECVACSKEWDGAGRLTIAYVEMYEMDDKHENPIWRETHDRGDEHNVTWCPDCKPSALHHTSKR